jgi:LysM repeat protein
MLKLNTHQAQPGVTSRVPVATQVNANSVHNGNSSARPSAADALTLTRASQERNPYQGTAPDHTTVKVGRWGTGKNDSVLGILYAQGYSKQDIYGKNAEGHSLLERVQQVNGLRNPNLIREGQELTIPVREKAAETNQPAQVVPETTPALAPKVESAPRTEAANSEQKPAVSQVRVGKWGQDKNGSLYEILQNQGFKRSQILNEDGDGDSLLKKVARANGLESPDRIREGATLNVPNSLDALNQMEVPERVANREPVQKLEVPKPAPIQRRELPKLETPPIKPIEVRPIESKPIEVTPVPPEPATTKAATPDRGAEATANMGLLLDGVKNGNFTRGEFQYLNALSNRYEETRSQYSKDGFDNDELKSLGSFETRYGVTYTRLYNSDDVKLSNNTQQSDDPKAQLRLRHYQEGGSLWDGFKDGSVDSDKAISEMIRQRAEARAQGGK